MKASLIIVCAVVAIALIGGAAAAFVLTSGATVRPNAARITDDSVSCAPAVRTSNVSTPLTPSEAQPRPTEEPRVERTQPDAALLTRLDKELAALASRQIEVRDLTEGLAVDSGVIRVRKRRGPAEDQPVIDAARLKEIIAAQTEIQQAATKLHETLGQTTLPELSADLEQVQRLLTAIMGALSAREPDIGSLTLAMQQGVSVNLGLMRKSLIAAPKVDVPELPLPAEGQSGPMIVAADKSARAFGDRNATEVRVERGATLTLGKGTLTLSGDLSNAGTLESSGTTLLMNGGNQNITGAAAFHRARFSGGTKRLTAGSRLATTYNQNSDKNNPVLVIEAGCTLVVEKDSELNVSNAYGLRVEGTLIIEGGIVNCSYTHGHGVENMNATWVKGSQLIIRSGSFIASGDASFDGASVQLQGGEIRCRDDIWGSGDSLDISGGVMSNSSGGGQFYFTGQVRMSGGRLEINQYEGRGFVVGANCDFWCSAGEIVLGGQDISDAQSGIVLGKNVQLPKLTLNVNTKISTNTPEGTVLGANTISIAKGKKFSAQGRQVIATIETGENSGTFEP
jgi:hypothetical protein